MPDKKERDMWWAFLAGKPESDWNPPKKSKAKKPPAYNSGLPAWADNSSQDLLQESWQKNDEGEVEQVLRVDPAESLPSPVGTPLSGPFESASQSPSSSCLVPAFEPREPTTRILKLIDEVRSFLFQSRYNANAFILANGLASAHVLHPLDQPLSSGTRFLSFSNRVAC